jgi:hypothetical protein
MSLRQYIAEAEVRQHVPEEGDMFAIELEDGTLLETYIIAVDNDTILLDTTPKMIDVLREWADLEGEAGEVLLEGQFKEKMHQAADSMSLEDFVERFGHLFGPGEAEAFWHSCTDYNQEVDEAEYQGHQVPLGKPMRGDVKKFKVYVRDPKTGNVKKVNFGHGGTSAKRAGQKTMRIKKSNPARRRSFRARHHCENPGPRTKARYWSCRAW